MNASNMFLIRMFTVFFDLSMMTMMVVMMMMMMMMVMP